MYTEEPRRNIDWGSVIKKGLLILAVAAVIFLIIWLFTRNNSNSINVDYGNESNNNVTETLKNSNSYSEIFIDNYRYFHDTAKEYFLVSELPATNKTIKYTLQELIDKGLILPFSYGNSTCDTEASYVTAKNDNGKYTMTTTLVCGKEVAKTTIELGCNQLCESNTCEPVKTTIEYQYKQAYKATETVYSCPSGYTKSGSGSNTKCVKSNSETINATKNVTYSCPSGYTKNGTKCTKTKTSTIDATKTTTYSCPSGYTKSGSGSNTKCYKTSNESVNAKYTTTYSCPSGYTLSGTKCTKTTTSTETKNATPKTTYSCPSGYSLNGTKCTKTTSSTDTKNATANTTYSCSKGTLVNEKYCRINSTNSYYQSYVTYKGKTYNGCSYSGSYTEACSTYSGCTRTYYKYYCTKSSYKDVDATPKTTYSCPSGYSLNGTKCTKTTSSTDTKNATANTTYSCASGYTLSGTKCTKTKTNTETKNATETKKYYCESGYVLNGTKCQKTTKETVNPTKTTTYSCPKGYTKNGTKCISTGSSAIDATKSTTYTCASGYTKVGIGSSAKCTKGSTTSVAATKSTKTVTKYKYKWSTETSLDGWERTGETRTVSSK